MKKTVFSLILLLAFFLPHVAQAKSQYKIDYGKEILLFKPLDQWKFFDKRRKTSLRFKVINPQNNKYNVISRMILNSKGLDRFFEDYKWLAGKMKRKTRPIPFVIAPQNRGPSFCIYQPYLYKWKGQTRMEFGPVIYLSLRNLYRLKKGRPQDKTLCHEMGHAVMVEYISFRDIKKSFSPEYAISALTGEGHWMSKITDPIFAYNEGWAEYCGWYYPQRLRKGKPYLKKNIKRLAINEGAISELLLGLTQKAKIPSMGRKLLFVQVKHNSSNIYEILQDFCTEYPSYKKELKVAVKKVTKGQWTFDRKYDLKEIYKDGRKNWQRLSKRSRAQLKALIEEYSKWEKWMNTGRELWEALPYIQREIQEVWPEIKRELPRFLKRKLPREIKGWLRRQF